MIRGRVGDGETLAQLLAHADADAARLLSLTAAYGTFVKNAEQLKVAREAKQASAHPPRSKTYYMRGSCSHATHVVSLGVSK